MSDLIPVHMTVRPSDGKVSIRMLLETPMGLALYDGDTYFSIGQVREGTWPERDARTGVTRNKKGWLWYFDHEEYGQAQGHELTKTKALASLLAEGGYVLAPPNATTPPLFDA